MKRFSLIILLLLITCFFLMTGCDSGVKTPKYPGQDAPVGEESVNPPGDENTEDTASSGGGAMMDFQGNGDGAPSPGKSAQTPAAPYGAEEIARPLQAEADEETADEEEADGSASEEDADSDDETDADQDDYDPDTPHRDKTPDKFSQLGIYNFKYKNADEGEIAKLNQLLSAIDLLTVNEQKYEHAATFLSTDEAFASRSDPLFIPEAVPDELRPLIPGDGIRGSLDQELRDLFRAQANASLRDIPIHITGVMEMSYSKTAQGVIWYYSRFRIGQGQVMRMGYWGGQLRITAVHISEDVVLLRLSLHDYRDGSQIGEAVPRSFHLSVT